MEVGFAPESLTHLQRAYLGLGLVLVVGALLVGGLSELVLLNHDSIAGIIDMYALGISIRNS